MAWCERPPSTRTSAGGSPRLCGRTAGPCSAPFPLPSRAARAIANFCSGLCVTERLSVSALGRRGDGVADGADGAIYIPFTLPGELVEVDGWPGHPDRRHLLRIERASSERIVPICPHFGVCGGCAVQHWDFERYQAWKRDLVVTALAQAGLDVPVDDMVDAHGEGRRRA